MSTTIHEPTRSWLNIS